MKCALFLLLLAVPPSQDAMDRDVQLLLKNDDAVALAKQQLAAKQTTNVEYTKQIQELTKARNDILARYDRNGQRQLTALYNAAKKDQASAAREAAARAAAEAQAKAKAEREAAQKAAAEKAEAEKQGAAAQARREEEDAGKVADLELRSRTLVMKQQLTALTEEEKSELARAPETLQALYGRHVATPDAAARFRARVAQIHQSRPVPGVNPLLVLVYPAASRVLADFPDDSRRAAALNLLKETLDRSAGKPLGPELLELSTSYFRAFNQVDGPMARQGYDSAAYRDYRDLRKKLEEDPAFRAEVLNKYLPPAVQKIADQSPAAMEAKGKALMARMGRRFSITVGVMILMPFVLLWLGGRFRKSGRTPDPVLPEELRTVRVAGLSYDIDLEAGLVIDERTWTETNTQYHTSPGRQETIGNTTYYTPGYSYTTTSTTRKDRIFVQTPEGKQTPWMCTDIGFETLKGHVVSRIAPAAGTPGSDDFLVLHNHTTGQSVKLPGVSRRHVVRKRYLWLATAAVGVLGTLWAFQLDSAESVTGHDSAWGTMAGILAFGALVQVGILALIVRLHRNRKFNVDYYPRLRRFLEERTPELLKRCQG